jgi:hypothetical protein
MDVQNEPRAGLFQKTADAADQSSRSRRRCGSGLVIAFTLGIAVATDDAAVGRGKPPGR